MTSAAGAAAQTRLVVVTNWLSELQERLGDGN
jgi:hypothetical protein